MQSKILSFLLVEGDQKTHQIRIPEKSEYLCVGAKPTEPTHFRVWFESGTSSNTKSVQLLILKENDEIPKGAKRLGTFVHADGAFRHVFMLSHRPAACKCNCAKGGECNHEWNGPWKDGPTCSTCGLSLNDHKFPPNARSSPYPRLRNKSAFQKDDCIACNAESTKEIVFGNAQIRCCENADCIDRAVEIAKAANDAIHGRDPT